MTEEEAKAVTNQEVGAPEAKTEGNANQTTSQSPAVGSKEFNFRQLEQKNKELEQRLREQDQFSRELLSTLKANNNQTKPEQQEDESLPELSPDDIPEWKHIKKTYASLEKKAEKIAEEKVKKMLAEAEKARLPQLAKSRYPDFDQVVTPERIQELEQQKPHLAKAFSMTEDPFTATYDYLKSLHGNKKPDPIAMEEMEKLRENASKPKSVNSIANQGALKNANTFVKKSKEELYREMMRYANQRI